MKRLVHTDFLAHLRQDITTDCIDTAYTLHRLEETTDDLLMWATHIEEIAAEMAADFRQAALGNTRTACQWCDGEFFVAVGLPGPHTCRNCRHCDGY